jgi:hypothetical protein
MTQSAKTLKPSYGPAPAAIASTLIVIVIVAAGAWVVAFGLPEREAAGWWVLGITLVLLVGAILSFRYVDPKKMSLLKKCLIVSVLLHVLIAFLFSAVEVTRQVVRWAHEEPAMTPAVNLQLAREMEVREQVRQQIQELPTIDKAPALTPQQVDSPLPSLSDKIESVGAPGTDLHQLASSRNPIAPTIPQASPAPDLHTPLLPVVPNITPVKETTPIPAPAADIARPLTHFPGPVNEQLARATTILPGSGEGELTAPPASLTQGEGSGGSATGAGTGKPFSLWNGKAPPPVPEKKIEQQAITPPPPVAPETKTTRENDLVPQRSFDHRQKLLQQNGGTPETEAAVARALVFFSKTQHPDGHWTKFINDPNERATDAHDTALTSLALLCYLAAGNTPDMPGPYQDNVRRAIAYILAHEDKNGDLRGDGNMYDQGISTLALSEAAAMTRDKSHGKLRDASHRAAQFVVEAQNGRGGWRYAPRDLFSDTSVMGWQILALHSAQRTGFEIPSELKRKATAYLDSVSAGKFGMLAGYLTPIPTSTMTAEATFTRMLMEQDLSDAQLDEAAQYMLRKPPARDDLNYYYIYYGSLALMQMQGPNWERWNAHTSRLLLDMQEKQGVTAGSWSPEDNEWGNRGGRIYTTALATLTLEVYYRYLPMYTHKK